MRFENVGPPVSHRSSHANPSKADAGHGPSRRSPPVTRRRDQPGDGFELRTKSTNPSLSIDVCVRDDDQRLLIVQECWNTFGNINASVRSTQRKVSEAQELAVAIGGDRGAYVVVACWIVRETRRNREILARYPEVFTSAFSGSSRAWVKALTQPGARPPADMGLVWCDLRARRIFAWRR